MRRGKLPGGWGLYLGLLLALPVQAQTFEPAPCSRLRVEGLLNAPLSLAERPLALFTQLNLSWPHLQALFAALQRARPELELESLQHADGAYALQLTVRQGPLWDRLSLLVDFPAANRLRLRLRDNWLPTGLLLDRLRQRLAPLLQGQPVSLMQRDEALELRLDAQRPLIVAGLSLNQPQIQAHLDSDGDLDLAFVSAGDSVFDPESPSQGQHITPLRPVNGVHGGAELCGATEPYRWDWTADTLLNLPAAETARLKLGGEALSERLEALNALVHLDAQGQLQTAPLNLEAQGTLQIEQAVARIQHKSYQLHSLPFEWRYAFPSALQIAPRLPAPPAFAPHFEAARLTLFPDGPDYFAELRRSLAAARHSIGLEVFSLHDGVTTGQLARLLVLRALGYREGPAGPVPDAAVPEGVQVRVLHNHGLDARGAQAVADFFARTAQAVFAELPTQQPDRLRSLQARLAEHLQLSALSDGVAWADHRKLLVIDGRLGYVGGRNWGDHYFAADSFRDQMVRVEGPAMAQLLTAFNTNWLALNPQAQPWTPAVTAGPKTPSRVAVLTTSRHGWQIEAALLQTIQAARREIVIEHAYLWHEPVLAALRAAKARGVRLRLLFSERSDESVFERLNPAAALQLLRAPGPGPVAVWLYRGSGEADWMVHTKYLAVDGRQAIAGSANLIPRSLHSPFVGRLIAGGKDAAAAGEDLPLLFNEEIALLIDDPGFVHQMNQALFERRLNASRPATAADLEALLAARGGDWQLLLEQLKGLLS